MTTLRRRKQCERNRAKKGLFQGVACPPEAKTAPPGAAERTMDPNRLKPL